MRVQLIFFYVVLNLLVLFNCALGLKFFDFNLKLVCSFFALVEEQSAYFVEFNKHVEFRVVDKFDAKTGARFAPFVFV